MHRHKNIFLICCAYTVLIGAVLSCKRPEGVPAVASSVSHFSLADYFGDESARLQQLDPEIVKTVSKNGEQESKAIRVQDWQEELALFIDADINKPAWRNSYHVDSTATSVTYTSTDPKLRTVKIRVEKRADGAIKHIQVTNQVSNMLYQTDEKLDYYPDSIYRIVKKQRVRIIGESNYAVTGEWQ